MIIWKRARDLFSAAAWSRLIGFFIDTRFTWFVDTCSGALPDTSRVATVGKCHNSNVTSTVSNRISGRGDIKVNIGYANSCQRFHRSIFQQNLLTFLTLSWKLNNQYYHDTEQEKKGRAEDERMVFCYQNCTDLLWEKNVLVIQKNFWNWRLKAENL